MKINSLRKKVSLETALFLAQAYFQCKFRQLRGRVRSFSRISGFCLPLVQNDPYATETYFSVAKSAPFQSCVYCDVLKITLFLCQPTKVSHRAMREYVSIGRSPSHRKYLVFNSTELKNPHTYTFKFLHHTYTLNFMPFSKSCFVFKVFIYMPIFLVDSMTPPKQDECLYFVSPRNN